MEDTLKRLLEVEAQAENMVSKANVEKEQIIQQSLQEAQTIEKTFEQKIPELQANFLDKAEIRAQQSIIELQKRYEEKKGHLQNLADKNQARALEAAVQLLMQVGKPS